jgi:hypothetical protein
VIRSNVSTIQATFNGLTLQRFHATLRFATRPLIGLQYGIEIGVRNGGVPVHQFFNDFSDAWKTQLSIQQSGDGDRIR